MGFSFSFGLLAGSVSSYEIVSPRKEIQWLASLFTGIIVCVVVYRLTAIFSSLLFDGYSKLTNTQKIDWNNRGFSTFHALFASFASFYLLILSNIFNVDSREELVVNRSSTLSDSVLAISTGYFLADLAVILWNFPALGGLEFVLHHGLSILSLIQSLLSGQAQIYILMVLFTESTTPFVNLRWHLDVTGHKNSKFYIWNGIALFFGWLVARIILFIFFFIHLWTHFDEVKKIFPLCFYTLLVVSTILSMMNIFWFWKIAKGMVKTLSKAKHSK
ncbi:putative TRAM/LAG1/CLN8 domain-containing protein [Lupinus albus]|uniref:Putative TRAM/LAG1/CLN8 domain-containing protein n=1 Tax=Lupinus albus TaxID=3870 RepID=A0A6A4P6W4_LUPAL|nr:putative TRAM/LAG1/CLN8 domain-containing protein [Lupinus albus]